MLDNIKIKVVDESTSAQTVLTGREVVLSTPSIVHLPVARAQVKFLAREGGDLVVTLIDGQTLVVHGYFASGQGHPVARSQLVLLGDDGGGLWQVDLTGLDAWPYGLIDLASASQGAGIFSFYTSESGDTTPDATQATQDTSTNLPDASSDPNVSGTEGVDADAGAQVGAQAGGAQGVWLLPLALVGAGLAVAAGSSGRSRTTTDSNGTVLPVAPTINTFSQNVTGTLTVAGQATAGDIVTVVYADGSTVSAAVDTDGSYTVTSTTVQTTGPVSVVQTDAVGTVSAATSQTWTDTTRPAAPKISTVTNHPDGTLTVTGTAEPNSTVTVTYLDERTANAIAGNDGSYTVTSSTAETSLTTVTATDAANNTSLATSYTPPAPPATPTIGATTGNPDGTITVTGSATPGSLVTAIFPDGSSAAAIAGSDGSYSIISTGAEPNGTISVSAIQAGSIASAAASVSYAQTDSVLVLSAISPDTGSSSSDFITSATTLTFSGALAQAPASGDVVQISFDGGKTWNPVTNITGANWTYDDTANPFTSGAYKVVVREIDEGGVTRGSWVQTLIIDTTAPTETASITALEGRSSGFVTADTQPLISGSLSAPLNSGGSLAETLQISFDDGAHWQDVPPVGITGTTWSYTPPTALAVGSYAVSLRVVDLAGNIGPTPGVQQITITAPVSDDAPTPTVSLTAISPDTGTSGSDFITDTGTLALTGAVSAALTGTQEVQISLNNGEWQPVTLGEDGLSWHYDTSGLADGIYTVQTRVYDTSSDLAGAITGSDRPIVIDSTAPTETVTISSASDGVTLSGALSEALNVTTHGDDSAETLQIRIDGGAWQTVPDSGIDGTRWTYTNTGSALSVGAHTIEAQVVDLAGNTGGVTTETVTVAGGRDTGGGGTGGSDTGGGGNTGATPAAIALTAITPDTGTSSKDFITDTNAITLSGTLGSPLTAGQTVQISLNGGAWQNAIVPAGSLRWTYNASADNLADGNYTVQTRIQDGSQSGVVISQSQTVVIDTAAPTETVAITGVTGGVATAGGFTTPTGALVISGTLNTPLGNQGGSREVVEVSLDGGKTWQWATTDSTGLNWSYDNTATPLTNGSYTVQARVIDLAGNIGASLATAQVQVASSTEPTAIITGILYGTDFVISSSTPIFTGTDTAAPGQVVQVSVDGGAWQPATLDTGNGTWSYDSPNLQDGLHTVQARVYDPALNQAYPASNSQTVLIDTTHPAETVTITSINGGAAAAGVQTADGALTISGTLSAPLIQTNGASGSQEQLRVSTDGFIWHVATVDDTGLNWRYTVPAANALPAGDYTVEARVVDLAGLAGDMATAQVRVGGGSGVSTTATITGIATGTDTGASAGGNLLTNTTQPTLLGTLSAALGPGQQLQINLGGSQGWQTVNHIGNDGQAITWQYIGTLPAGSNTVQTRVFDTRTGQTGAASSQTVIVDTTPPAETALIATVNGQPGASGVFTAASGALTIAGTLSAPLAGTGSAADAVQVSLDGGSTWQTATATGATWTYTSSAPLLAGLYAAQARVVDAAGNASATATAQVQVGGVNTPLATLTGISPDTGTDAHDLVTTNMHLIFSGALSAPLATGQQVQISLDNGANWQNATVNGLGWTYDNTATALPEGSNAVRTRVVGTDGQGGTVSTRQVIVDDTAPIEHVTITTSNISIATGAALTVSGTLDGLLSANGGSTESVQVSLDGGQTWQKATTDGTTWSYATTAVTLPPGYYYGGVQARVTDAAGNSGAVATQDLQVTGGLPVVTAFNILYGGQSGTEFITRNNSPYLYGSLSAPLAAGQELQISIDGLNWTPASVSSGSTGWFYDDTTGRLPDGSYVLQARVFDSNTGQFGAVASQTMAIDTTAPTEVVTITSIDGAAATAGGYFSVSSGHVVVSGTLDKPLNSSGGSPETVEVSLDGGITWRPATVDASGLNWSYDNAAAPLPTGNYNVEVHVTDLAANEERPVAQALLVVGGGAMPTAAITNASSATDGSGAMTLQGALSAALDPGQQLQISLDNGAHWQQVSNLASNGSNIVWRYEAALSAGANTVETRVVDTVHNLTGQANSQTVTVQGAGQTATVTGGTVNTPPPSTQGDPNLPLATSTDIRYDNGPSSTDFITNDAAVFDGAVSASLSPGQVVQVSTNGVDWLTASVNPYNNTWSYDTTGTKLVTLAEGSYTLLSRVFDTNTGQAGTVSSQPIVIDNTSPTETPTITAVDGSAPVNGNVSLTSGEHVTISGTLNAPLNASGGSPEMVQVSVDDGKTWQTATVDPSNDLNWSFAATLGAGTYQVQARVGDLAGNGGNWANGVQVQVGGTTLASDALLLPTSPPTETATIAPGSDGLTLTGTLSAPLGQSGSAETLQISLDGGNTWQVVPASGISGATWSYTSSTPLEAGLYIVEARVANANGQTGPVTASPVSVGAGSELDLNLSDILNAASTTGQPVEIPASANAVTVNLADGLGSGATQWQETGTTTVNGTAFDVYHNAAMGASTTADLLVQAGIRVI